MQVQLYEDFAKSRAKVNVDDVLSTAVQEDEDKPKLKATGHVFQVRHQWRSSGQCFSSLIKPLKENINSDLTW